MPAGGPFAFPPLVGGGFHRSGFRTGSRARGRGRRTRTASASGPARVLRRRASLALAVLVMNTAGPGNGPSGAACVGETYGSGPVRGARARVAVTLIAMAGRRSVAFRGLERG